MTLVAIHQPSYLPWLGYFSKLRSCDIFVILDDVQVSKTGSTWINRSRILNGGSTKWLTVPIRRPAGFQEVRQVEIADSTSVSRHRRIVETCYYSAPYYSQLSEFLDDIFRCDDKHISELNIRIIKQVLDRIGLSDANKFVLASSLNTTSVGTDRLVDIVKELGGSAYLSGDGSHSYLDPKAFEMSGIELIFQHFVEDGRPQLQSSSFVRGLSVLDSLLMVGTNETRRVIEGV